uniref:Candidate secreted effector n=1 Tax=Meloidogyne incognita TaxID=6306 RepID=A0A914NCN6_MELIC
MSSLLFKFYIIFLILLIINNCNSSRIKIQRNLNRYTSTPKPASTLKEENELVLDENEDESPILRLIRSFKQKQQKKKKQKEKELQCWIRINKKLGEMENVNVYMIINLFVLEQHM